MARHLALAGTPPAAPSPPTAAGARLWLCGPPLQTPRAELAGMADAAGFSAEERRAVLALARATVPAGAILPAAGEASVNRFLGFLATVPAAVRGGYRAALASLRSAARVRHGRALADLSEAEVLALCESVRGNGFAGRSLIRFLVTPIKVAHIDDAAIFALLDQPYGTQVRPAGTAQDLPRHVRERTQSAVEVPSGEVLECDVVVIGTGAGGAVAARELAEAGHAVILLEEGPFFTRADFTGHTWEMQQKLYRDLGATVAVGNTVIPVPVGRGVGGTTLVNSGTCYRPLPRVLHHWSHDLGLPLSEAELAPYLDKVEEILGVAPAQAQHLGGVATVIARGADALGYRHGPLRRNAPDCDAQGVCCFGCPTDAKRSTNISYVPAALRAGAQLYVGARASRILVEGGRAAGVEVTATGQGAPRFTVRARAVVLAAGALLTPVLLQSQRETRAALRRSGQLGRNLSIHPAAGVFAVMPERVQGVAGIPQGYAIEEFQDQGLLMEGVFFPMDLGAASITTLGPRFTAVLENYPRLASFGFLVEDEGRGVVRPGPGGRPLISYFLSDRDTLRVQRGVSILTRLFLRAGAELVVPPVQGIDEIRDEAGLRRLAAMHLRARDFELTAYHPLGTARMGRDPATSVVDSDHQAHDLPGLYVCDGSALPTSPAVNPQVTIMALATRAAQRLAQRLSRSH